MRSRVAAALGLALVSAACSPEAPADPSPETTSSAEADSGSSDSGDETGDGDPGDGDPGDGDPEPTLCNLLVQACPEGEKCVPFVNDRGIWDEDGKCVPVLGDHAGFEPCTYDGPFAATDDCDGDSFCWGWEEIDGALVGECAPFCIGATEPACPEGSTCVDGDFGVPVCVSSCDPLVQDCELAESCGWDDSLPAFQCAASGGAGQGESCLMHHDCAAGLTCLAMDYLPGCMDAGCCSAFCDLSEPDECDTIAPGTSCVAYFFDPPPEYADIGACAVL